MLDAYSFHETEEDRTMKYALYDGVLTDILESVGSGKIEKVEGDSGPMGGAVNHEYHVRISHVVAHGSKCHLNLHMHCCEALRNPILKICQCTLGGKCFLPTDVQNSIQVFASRRRNLCCKVSSLLGEDHSPFLGQTRTLELGHIFQLPSTYCEAFGVRFTDSLGRNRTPLMNCYGLGLSRLLGHLALKCSDPKGIIFPSQVSPFTVVIIPQPLPRWASVDRSRGSTGLVGSNRGLRGRAWTVSQALYSRLQTMAARIGGPCDVLLDDRPGISLGKMQAHADLIGIPHQVLVKAELLKLTPPRIIYINRSDGCPKSLSLKSALSLLHAAYLAAAGRSV